MQYVLFAIIAPAFAIVSIVVFVHAWRHRDVPGASALLLYQANVIGFLIGNTLELTSPTADSALFWTRLDYVFIAGAPVAWFAMALQYSGRRDWLRPSRYWVFFLVPAVTVFLLYTSVLHGLVWTSVRVQPVAGGYMSVRPAYGLWFWVHALYCYGLFLVGIFLIGREWLASPRLRRARSIWLLIGALAPAAANLSYLFHLIPGLQKDYTPISFALAGSAFAIAIFAYRLFDVMPIARATLVDQIDDGMVVLDESGRLVDVNAAARRILGLQSGAGIGLPAHQALPPVFMAELRCDASTRQESGTVLDAQGSDACYELRVIPLTLSGQRQDGELVVMHEITDRVRAEQALVQANQELEARVEARTRDLSRRATELEALEATSSAMRRAVTHEGVLSVLTGVAVDALGAASALVLLCEDDRLRVAARCGVPEDRHGQDFSACADPTWEVVNTGRPLDLPAVPEGGPILEALLPPGTRRVVIAPLQSSEANLGVLVAGFSASPGQADGRLELLTTIAEIGGNTLERVRLVETLEQRVRSRTRELAALYDVTAITGDFQDLYAALERIVDKTLEVLSGSVAMLHLLEDDGKTLQLVMERGGPALPAGPPDQSHFGGDQALWDRVLETDRVVLGAGLFAGPDGAHSQPADEGPVYVGVPMHAKGRVLGTLCVQHREVRRLATEDIALLAAIADHAGDAVENAYLRQKAEQAAVLYERQRLARELHDSVTQSLYSMVILAGAGKDALEAGDGERALGSMARLDEASQQALKEMRLLIYDLRPSVLQQEGLVEALRRHLETVERRAGLAASLEAEELPVLEAAVEAGLYRLAQEALNNVVKHSGAAHVRVRLHAEADDVCLEIVDDGRGFDPLAPQTRDGMGISGMRERVEALQGRIRIFSAPELGTRILVCLPRGARLNRASASRARISSLGEAE